MRKKHSQIDVTWVHVDITNCSRETITRIKIVNMLIVLIINIFVKRHKVVISEALIAAVGCVC